MSEFLLHILCLAGIYAIVALALNLQAGYAGLLNFGHIVFVGTGAYAIGLGSNFGLPLWLVIPTGLLCAIVISALMTLLGRQLTADYWGIATLALAEIIRIAVVNEDHLTGGAQGIGGLSAPWSTGDTITDTRIFAVIILLSVIIATLASLRIGASRFGRALRLMREQPQLAICMGYALPWLKCRALMSSAVMCCLAGMLLAWYTDYVSPDYLLSSETFLIWSMVMIGGIGNVRGVLLGVLLVEGLYNFIPFSKDYFHISSDLTGALRLGLVGLALLLCLLTRPGGLLPEKLRTLS
ncbi:Branched-chain amino acid transport system permease protein LivM (TC 3.A.1.4.1) [Kosakonia radicincitans]|uniref:branched-chain amino acid ABC transporter permease n=1 Tax=Kosakonia radicincitans TaxID=283686 RepID=UPI001182A756|nr:branched-chain amino acid ABC transporter permease [Kosakonia radicincitans]VVT49277.1 Branched-chain amino acid transport system permease protein LivM (TC 3.A.1.4.1) [Kosakonia radicincitans]